MVCVWGIRGTQCGLMRWYVRKILWWQKDAREVCGKGKGWGENCRDLMGAIDSY